MPPKNDAASRKPMSPARLGAPPPCPPPNAPAAAATAVTRRTVPSSDYDDILARDRNAITLFKRPATTLQNLVFYCFRGAIDAVAAALSSPLFYLVVAMAAVAIGYSVYEAPSPAQAIFEQIDSNHDGRITLAEIQAVYKRRFNIALGAKDFPFGGV